MTHTCIKDDGGTPGRVCIACRDEQDGNRLLVQLTRMHIEKMRKDAIENGCPNLAERIEKQTDELIRVIMR